MLKKNHKKLVPLAMVLIMAALLVFGLSMNVFAGTGKNGVIEAPKCVVKIQGDSSRCMKKSDLVQLETTLCEGAKFEGFVGGDPEVATVNSHGVVKAVGPGETTITARARLKGSSKIYTATCKVIVTGLIAESIEANRTGATTVEATVKGTAYGTYGKKIVDGKLSEAGIEDVMDIEGIDVNIKDTVILQNGGTLNVNDGVTLNVSQGSTLNVNYGTLNFNGYMLNVNDGGRLNVNDGGTFNVNGPLNGSHTLNVNSGGTLNFSNLALVSLTSDNKIILNSGGTLNFSGDIAFASQLVVSGQLNINSSNFTLYGGVTLDVDSGGTLNVNGQLYVKTPLNVNGTLNVNSGGTLNVQENGLLNVNSNGTLNVNSNGTLNVSNVSKLNVDSSGIFQVKNGEKYDTIAADTYSNRSWTGK